MKKLEVQLSSCKNNSGKFVILEHCIINKAINEFEVEIVTSPIEINIIISTELEMSNEKIENFFINLYLLIFLNYGFYFKIVNMKLNDTEIDLNSHYNLGCFSTNEHHVISDSICSLTNLITKNVFNKFIKILEEKRNSLITYTYLCSNSYAKVLITHRFTMLLQLIEGFVYNERTTYKGRLKILLEIVQKYDTKFHCEYEGNIFNNYENLSNDLANTRHLYSHYNDKDPKKNYITNGEDMIYIYNVMCYSFRILFFEKIGVNFNDENIRQYFLSVYDWKYSNDCKEKGNNPDNKRFKSITYKSIGF